MFDMPNPSSARSVPGIGQADGTDEGADFLGGVSGVADAGKLIPFWVEFVERSRDERALAANQYKLGRSFPAEHDLVSASIFMQMGTRLRDVPVEGQSKPDSGSIDTITFLMVARPHGLVSL